MVFAEGPQFNHRHASEIHIVEETHSESSNPNAFKTFPLLQAIIESLMDGVMLISDNGKVLQANRLAKQLCRKLNSWSASRAHTVPPVIWRICQAVLDSYELFPQHRIIPESELVLPDGTVLRIRAQCIQGMDSSLSGERPYLLVMIEDRDKSIQSLAASEIHKYGLTPCEGKVWQLRLEGCSYREIAAKLYISENTVKKHVRSALAKRRAFRGGEEEAIA